MNELIVPWITTVFFIMFSYGIVNQAVKLFLKIDEEMWQK
ncbi:hypothetical protein PITCH_A1680020 [uncultured Desulfobacterium sp.]|uniref:Uncharacterized protein n=1 Tax=uncultured Desulfobacterium sp. TaxID=201089 RepID=A0A445MUJ0_9BACT|nr:hypothetical protein PITCH_A1680020 [uncultured Desulfobacterium sp.]